MGRAPPPSPHQLRKINELIYMAKPKQNEEVTSDRQARWEAFLEAAREQRPNKAIFDAQKARGEFDTIPESFQ